LDNGRTEVSDSVDKQKQLYLDYQSVFATEAGIRVLEDLKVKGYEKTTTYHQDARQHAFTEGGRAFLLDLLNMLSVDVTKLEQQQKENDNHG